MNILHKTLTASVTGLLLVEGQPVMAAPAVQATLYKSPSCGCCHGYIDYLKKNNFKLKVVDTENLFAVQNRLGTANAASCHTMQIGRYVVEGHVPVASIQKMLKERPDIKGIALPGMPATAPGMGPAQKGSLKVVKLDHKGNQSGVFLVE